MAKIVFTVDVDRDAACAAPGEFRAKCKHSIEPSFEASYSGFRDLLGLADSLRIPAVFFFEAECVSLFPDVPDMTHEIGCHGLHHEDFTGAETNAPITESQRLGLLTKAKEILENRFGSKPMGFRAPYLHHDSALLQLLQTIGFAYDSSVMEGKKAGPLPELFLPDLKDAKGKQTLGYLWQLMEGNRSVEEYLEAINSYKGKYLVLSTHSWHSRQTMKKKLSEQQAKENLSKVKQLLETLKERHEFVSAGEVLG
ncbi:polysaccharide deacetylase family protein [Candidatus Micrarchaeota archaeon]|nr:polysaccharide deacetylase family protein [Candidatus Micrarchaeota archaeon]